MIRLRDIPKMNVTINNLYEGITKRMLPTPKNTQFSSIGMEVTTFCNSRCDFCAHEEIIKSGIRPMMNMSMDTVKRSFDYIKNINDGKIKIFAPLGLGETLLHPNLLEILKMVKDEFPGVYTSTNTNCIKLRGEIAERLIDGDLDAILLSTCFVSREDYRRRLHTEYYDHVMQNIEDFLKLKGDRKPSVRIHVFDIPQNRKLLWKWVGKWSPMLNSNDHLSIHPFVENNSNDRSLDFSYRNFPCSQVKNYDSIKIDIQGNILPCCSALWKNSYEGLIIGNINDGHPELIKEKLDAFKRSPPCDLCRHCTILRQDSDIGGRR